MSFPTPSFKGWHAVVLHGRDDGIERLIRQLERLGLSVTVQWSPLDLVATPCDLVLVDADQGWDDLLPWPPGEPPVPLIALLGSEAPGRIAWALRHTINALIAKPILAAAVYPALVMAAHRQAERSALRDHIAHLEERIRLRPLVHSAVNAIMQGQGVDEDAAYRLLRQRAMQQRIALEQAAAAIVLGRDSLPEVG